MDKISRLFLNQVGILQKHLEHLLEKKPIASHFDEPSRTGFQVSTDLSQIDSLKIGLPEDTQAKVPLLFSRLTVYFESGLLFQGSPGNWKAIAGFDQGEFFPLKGMELAIPFQFPQMTLIEVRRVSAPEIFSHLRAIKVIRNEKNQALIFRPHPDYLFLVTSSLGDPWLKTHLEKIQKEILLLLADQF